MRYDCWSNLSKKYQRKAPDLTLWMADNREQGLTSWYFMLDCSKVLPGLINKIKI